MQGLGVAIGSRRDVSTEAIVSLAQLADRLGYASVWVGESWGRDAFTLLTMIACHTSKVHLATGIVPVYSRTPALLAQTVASLDAISNGRAILGLGTSGRLVIEQWHGEKFDRPLQRTREYIEIIRMALAGERVNYEGHFYQVQRFRMATEPVQDRLPIYVASLGPKNLELTGQLADGWLPTWVDVLRLPEMTQQVVQPALAAGRSASDVTVAPQVLALASNTEEENAHARNLARAHMAYYVGGMGTYYNDLFRRYGYVEESARVREAWEAGDRERAAQSITDEMLDNITIIGDRDDCLRKVEKYRQAGADMPVLAFPHGASIEAMERTLEALAPSPDG
jgi:coenzyme F420-dependent oxidoreductase